MSSKKDIEKYLESLHRWRDQLEQELAIQRCRIKTDWETRCIDSDEFKYLSTEQRVELFGLPEIFYDILSWTTPLLDTGFEVPEQLKNIVLSRTSPRNEKEELSYYGEDSGLMKHVIRHRIEWTPDNVSIFRLTLYSKDDRNFPVFIFDLLVNGKSKIVIEVHKPQHRLDPGRGPSKIFLRDPYPSKDTWILSVDGTDWIGECLTFSHLVETSKELRVKRKRLENIFELSRYS